MLKRMEAKIALNPDFARAYWGIVRPSEGPRRVFPPLGAHSEGRKTPRSMWYMGAAMRNYSPLVAEHLMWAARPTDQDMEVPLTAPDPYAVMYQQPDNYGTNPHLRTAKYTGYGITLRAEVDTPHELSVHLIQVDDGPNYRWGIAGEGGCGVIYFYANGKGYSHNAREDVGDRAVEDTDLATNFGVWKDGVFRSVGRNVLSRPHYDLRFAQFAEIVPRQGPAAYSWPEYVSRSVMLAGDDYFLVHDKVSDPQVKHRFSWFVSKGDEFPHITMLTGPQRREIGLGTSVETEATSGRWIDGAGDSLAVVTYKEGIQGQVAPFGGRVTLPGGSDLLFASQKTIQFHEIDSSFRGTSGIIRKSQHLIEMALFHGTHIAAAGLSFDTPDGDLGISARITTSVAAGVAEGYFFAPSVSTVEIGLPSNAERMTLYIDGTHVSSARDGRIAAALPPGAHRWELTAGLPVPLPPLVEWTEYMSGGVIVHGVPWPQAPAIN